MNPRRSTSSNDETHLRAVVESDLPALFLHQCEPEANEMAAFPARDRDAFMAHWTKILADESVEIMTIVHGDTVAGNIGSWEQDGKRFIGYWIGKEHWGKGIATQALSEFLHRFTYRPVFAIVAKHNAASVRVLEKCGFKINLLETEELGGTTKVIEEWVYSCSSTSSQDPAKARRSGN